MTRLLTRSDLQELLDPASCIAALKEGFSTTDSSSVTGQRVHTALPFPGTATALIPGVLPTVEAYTVKVNAKFGGAQPALRGVVCLNSGADGELLALMDSATITAWRTGLAAAVGTDILASPDSSGDAVLGIVGAGAQAELMMQGLATMRRFGNLVVHDSDASRAGAFVSRHGGRVLSSAVEVADAADVVLIATWARSPLVHLVDVQEGKHITTLGVDEPGKQEVSSDLLESALLVVDDRDLASTVGALAAAGLPASAADATLGEIMRGEHPGRTTMTARSIYSPVGLPWQDLALAWIAYQRAERLNLGESINLLS